MVVLTLPLYRGGLIFSIHDLMDDVMDEKNEGTVQNEDGFNLGNLSKDVAECVHLVRGDFFGL